MEKTAGAPVEMAPLIWPQKCGSGPRPAIDARKSAIFFLGGTQNLPPAKGPEKGPKSGRLGFRSKIGRLGASERQKTAVRRPKNSPKKNFEERAIFFPKVHPASVPTHPRNSPPKQQGNFAPGVKKVPMWGCHVKLASPTLAWL